MPSYKPIPTMTAKDVRRFWKYVVKSDGCWEWTSNRVRGDGTFLINYRDYKSSRVSYALAHGSCDTSLMVCHKCDNPSCVNPEHLFLGTGSDNMLDSHRKGRQPKRTVGSHCRAMYKKWRAKNPLVFSGENSPRATLNNRLVRKIMAMKEDGRRCVDIANSLGLSWASVNFVIKGKCWNHITGLPRNKPKKETKP